MCPICYSMLSCYFDSIKHVCSNFKVHPMQISPQVHPRIAISYVSGVAVSCQVKGNLIKCSSFSVLFNFVFQTSHIMKLYFIMTGS